ncbi:hypothetical protein QP028_14820 [Corynebacterium suedekumii]|nr:hypothetical protein QP028_14820 [Corynebacterium suedekumii]
MHRALRDDDLAMLQDVATIWHDGFTLAGFDPELQVSSGPFRIESVGESGEVILAPNGHYFGDAPSLDRLVVWPSGSDQQAAGRRRRPAHRRHPWGARLGQPGRPHQRLRPRGGGG